MIKKIEQDYKDDNLAIRECFITFLGIPIFRHKSTTTNSNIVGSYNSINDRIKIEGFKNENKSKRNN